MRIEIDVSAANDPGAHGPLDRILHKFEDGWHVWDTAREPSIDALKGSTWVNDQGRQGKRVREMLIQSIRREAWGSTLHGRRVRVTVQPEGPTELVPEEAARLADEPLVILVENRNSDGAFLERVVTELDKPLRGHWRRPGEPVRVDSVGGMGEMRREVLRRTGQRGHGPRLVAIIDSDRKGPNDEASPGARRLQRTCEQCRVPCWVHAKREAENYLPRVLLAERRNAGADHSRRIEAWDRLTDDQKDFFDMKNGLPMEPVAAEAELFDGLSPRDMNLLSDGFGPNVHECWNDWRFQAMQELRARGRGELERGIALIREGV